MSAPVADETYRAGSLIDGQYRLLRVLGRGSCATVWQAEDGLDGRAVAVKLLSAGVARQDRMVRRLLAEARVSSLLAHPNVVRVYGSGISEDGEAYLVMEVLEGETLEATIERRSRLPYTEACAVMAEVLDTLACAHDRDIVHRDIKPANVMRLRQVTGLDGPTVKVLDFGVALGLAEGDALGDEQGMFGTPSYMSPEQVRGERVDHRSDLYAAGVVLYELLSGQHPTGGANLNMVLVNILGTPPRPLSQLVPEVPRDLTRLVMASLAKDPTLRPGSARVLFDTVAAHAETTRVRASARRRVRGFGGGQAQSA